MTATLRRLVWPNLIFSLVFLLFPLGLLVERSFLRDSGYGRLAPGLTLANLSTLFHESYFVHALEMTLLISVLGSVIATLVSLPVAYELSRLPARWMRFFLVLLLAPNFVSVVIRSIGWVAALGNNGPVNFILAPLGLHVAPLNRLSGVLLGEATFYIPIITLILTGVFTSIPRELEEAAEMLGASRWSVYRRVLGPLVLPGAVVGTLTLFSFSTGVYTSIILLGGNKVITLTVLMYQEFVTKIAYGTGSAASLVLVVVVFLVNLVSLLLTRRVARYL